MIAPTTTDYLLFGKKRCSLCGKELPACTDFFAPDHWRGSGMVSQCRACRSQTDKASYRRRKAVAS
jgi:hypothetical protein